MTKYILNSGGIKHQPELKKQFHQEIFKDLGSQPRTLLCNFAQPREDWELKFPGYSDSIARDMPEGVAPSLELAMPATFVNQCQQADVIYFSGGDDHLLQYWMKQFNLTELFKDKVVATNSASSDMLMESIKKYREVIKNVEYREFKGYGHFTLKRMGTVEFPELLEEIL